MIKVSKSNVPHNNKLNLDKITVNLQAVNAPILEEKFMKLKCRKVMMFGELNKNIKKLLVKSGHI